MPLSSSLIAVFRIVVFSQLVPAVTNLSLGRLSGIQEKD